MRTALVIALESPNPSLPKSFSFDYGFPRNALLIASCIQEWGAKVGLFPKVLNADLKIRKKWEDTGKNKDVKAIFEDVLVEAIRVNDPELICIVAPYTNVANWAIHAARVCKATKPQALVVTGGAHASFVPQLLVGECDPKRGPIFDAVILGPGEAKLKHLLENFDDPSRRFHHHGISTPQNPLEFSSRAQCNDIPIPVIDYGIIQPDEIGHEGAVIMAGRGCPYTCPFCVEALYWSQASIPYYCSGNALRVRNELIALSRLQVPVFGCGDSVIDLRNNFFPRIKSFFEEALSGLDLHEHFYILTRLHMLNKTGCQAFRKAGGRAVWVGIETANPDLLTSMGKGEIPYIIDVRLREAKRSDLRVGAFFMFGYPGETAETARNTLKLIDNLFAEELIDYVDPSIFVPYPGLHMYNRPDDYKLKPYEPAWSDWDNWGRYNEPPVYDLMSLSRNEIFQYWKEAIEIKRTYDIREIGRVAGGRA